MADIKQKPIVHMENAMRIGDSLYGTVKNHPRIADGRFALTSSIIAINDDRTVVETCFSIYHIESWYDDKGSM